MAVAFDAKTAGSTGTNVVFQTNALTVGVGGNRALLVAVQFVGTPTAITMTWDYGGSDQAMELIDEVTGHAGVIMQLWGLVNPVSGAKYLRGAWTSSSDYCFGIMAVSGARQDGGAGTFKNVNSNWASSNTSSVTIAAATGDMVFAHHHRSTGTFTSNSDTEWFPNRNWSGASIGNYANGATSVSLTAGAGTSNAWVSQGVAIAAMPDLAANGLTVAAPILGTSTLTQKHVLASVALTTAAPVVGTATASFIRSITASNLIVAVPVFGTPAVLPVFAMTATSLVVGAPTFGTLMVSHEVHPASLLVGPPLISTPTLVAFPSAPVAAIIANRDDPTYYEMVATNLNAAIDIQMGGGALGGRTDSGIGVMQAIVVEAPLTLENQRLGMRPAEYNFLDLPLNPPAGAIAQIIDSAVNTPGIPVSGIGGYRVLAWFNGNVWTVIGI